MRTRHLAAAAALALVVPAAGGAQTLLYRQNFEAPTGFVNDGGDFNIFRTVNDLYGGQPAGFTFAQNYTVETLLIGGTEAFGTGYVDPSGRGGKYALGLLSDRQDDYLGLAFNVGAYRFLNFRLDISSIDLDRQGGPFVPAGGLAPTFRFSLFDNPGGATGLGSGTPLAFADVTGTVSPNKYTFDFRNVVVALNATGNTDGNVILRVDLLSGGYAAMDNFVIAAADDPGGGLGVVPEPATWLLFGAGAAVLGAADRLRRVRGVRG